MSYIKKTIENLLDHNISKYEAIKQIETYIKVLRNPESVEYIEIEHNGKKVYPDKKNYNNFSFASEDGSFSINTKSVFSIGGKIKLKESETLIII